MNIIDRDLMNVNTIKDKGFNGFSKFVFGELSKIEELHRYGESIIAGGFLSFLYRMYNGMSDCSYSGDIDIYVETTKGNEYHELLESKRGILLNIHHIKKLDMNCIKKFDINSTMIALNTSSLEILVTEEFVEYAMSGDIKIIKNSSEFLIRSIIRAWNKEFNGEGSYLEFNNDIQVAKEEVLPVSKISDLKWKTFFENNDILIEKFGYIFLIE